MAVPTIPTAIALTDIQTEFGGANPISINEYYAGGTYVASGTANATSVSIPASGQIAFSNFSGSAAGYAALVKAFSISSLGTGVVVATARWGGAGSIEGDWDPITFTLSCNVSAYSWTTIPPGSTYDIMSTKVSGSGTLTGITNNTWTRLNTNVSITLSRSLVGIVTCTSNVQIKYNSNSTLISSNHCVWSAERKF